MLIKLFNQEHFCTSLCTGESEWPKPVFRGQARPGLEKDIILIKSLPLGIYSLLGIFQTQSKNPQNFKDLLTSDWRSLYRVSAILRALMNQLLAHWEASRHPTTTASPEQLKKSVQLVTTLGKARLIPPILADTALMYEFVAPYDLFLLMNAIWGFLHCNPANQELG